jgi:hypothetical protein
MIAQSARIGWGIDTIASLTAKNCEDLRNAGATFVCRYLSGLTADEIAIVLDPDNGFGLVPIGGYARGSGWGQGTGHDDGMIHVQRAQKLDLPESVHLWLDCEGQGGTAEDWLAYVSAWASVVTAAGYQAGAYEGAGVPLSGAQWYSIAGITGYWESCSVVPRVGTCGPMLQQWHAFNQQFCGLEVDFDFCAPDARGRMPVMVAAG